STLTWLKNSNLQDSNYCDLSGLSGTQEYGQQPPSKPNQCGGLDCEACLKGVFKCFQWQNLGQGIQKALKSKNNRVSTPLFVAVIPNGRAWIVPQQNYWLVCKAIAIITPDNQLLADVSREYPAPLPGCPSYDPQQHQVFHQEQLPPLQQIEGRVAVLSGLSGNVYFHWMVDILPRLELLRQSGIKFDQIDWFLVNSYQAPFQRETLTRLGIPEFKILESDRFPHIQAQQLIVPSWTGYMGWLQPWAIDTLRRWFLPKSQNLGRNYPERIYISRGNASYRRILNEKNVIETLRPWGFVTVQLETLSFGEQVALFAQAKVIMGAHGSGLTNILFCQPGTQVIEWMSPHYNRHYYWVISQQLGLKHYYITGEVFSCYPLRKLMYQSPLIEDIYVKINQLEKILKILDSDLQNQTAISSDSTRFKARDQPLINPAEISLDLQQIPFINYHRSSSINMVTTSSHQNGHHHHAGELNMIEANSSGKNPTSLELFRLSKQENITLTESNLIAIENSIKTAETYFEQKNYQRVIQECQKVITLNPNTVEAYHLLGKSLQGLGKPEEALKWYQYIVNLKPNEAIVHANLGNLYAQLKQWKPAIHSYQKAIKLQPDLALAHRNLGKVWSKLGKLKMAASCWYQAFSLEPQNIKP
ncbi:MAG TPA: hypothetical protein DEF27_09385, partial [Oscillatoriales bacterium UBA8482]|nr:hypothetical protein [Oscillatoriales bacterium UBA8482]